MNLKHITIGVAAVFVLAGCNTTKKDAEGLNDTGIEQTRYNNDMNGTNERIGMDDGIGMNDNGTMNDRNMGGDRNDGTVDDNKINSGTMNDDKKYNTSEKAAEKITADIPEIKRAHVLMTDNNAYVVATFDKMANDTTGNNDALLTDEVKKKISKVVKSTEKNIDNVYVTTNPDFGDLVGNYSNDVKNGKPIGGFFDQVGNMIERVFPQDKR